MSDNEKKVEILSIDEIIEKKKEKNVLENLSINYTHLLITLTRLITSINFGNEFSPYYVDLKYNFNLTEDQLKLLNLHNFWRKALNESYSKLSWNFTPKFLAHLSYKNQLISFEIMKIVLEDLLNKDDEEMKCHLRVIEEFINLNLRGDDSQKNFVKIIL